MHRIGIVMFVCLVSACAVADAQEQRTFGVGISLNPTSLLTTDEGNQMFLPVGMTNVRLAITPSPKFRIEPEFGIYSSSMERSASTLGTMSESFSSTRLGVSLYYRAPITESFAILAGPRFGLLWLKSTDEESGSGTTETRTRTESDLYAGAGLGGEYMLSQHFGIGAEAQLNYVNLGEPETEYTPARQLPPDPTPSVSISRSLVTTNALVFVHFYF